MVRRVLKPGRMRMRLCDLSCVRVIALAAGVVLANAATARQSVEILANQLIGIESDIYLCRSTESVAGFMALLPRTHYRAMRGALPRGCRTVTPERSSVALISAVEKFGVIRDVSGLGLRPFLVVVVDGAGQRIRGVSFLSADITLRANAMIPGDPAQPAASLREYLGE